METGIVIISETVPVPAQVPASVQHLLRQHGVIPDWNLHLHSRDIEWVENRVWVFQTVLPREWLDGGPSRRLRCQGLDHAGWICCNGRLIGRFENGFTEHCFDLSGVPLVEENTLQIVFDLPPRWLGQVGYTSRIKDWKVRFNYTWDWQPRMVQTGVWDRVLLEISDGYELAGMRCMVGRDGLTLYGQAPGPVEICLEDGLKRLLQATVPAEQLAAGAAFAGLPVEPWWPNRAGAQKTYRLICRLLSPTGVPEDEWARTIGFKRVEWEACKGAAAGTDPWICVVNGHPLFLQGVNWTPICPNYADLKREDYELRIRAYAAMGINLLRVWGGAFLETEVFYELCDQYGLLVWQEFPFSSSGVDNWPPEDPAVIAEARSIVRSYIARRQHHASLLCWCGGNELQGALDGGKVGAGKPVDRGHPLIAMMAAEVATLDSGRRFLPTSASGRRFMADEKEFGRGLHWDVHGPWFPAEESYWAKDDACFRSEVGAPGASPLDILERYHGCGTLLPLDASNPAWRRFGFWIQADAFQRDHGRQPLDLPEFVAWSQRLQREGLVRAVKACKGRFPACGGIIIWMGHDTFPCPVNTALLDFYGRPKPAAEALQILFLQSPGELAAGEANPIG